MHFSVQVVPTVTVRINQSADMVLSNGFVIPRNTTVGAIISMLHMNPHLFPEPERYEPFSDTACYALPLCSFANSAISCEARS
jgi:hypothetical protein